METSFYFNWEESLAVWLQSLGGGGFFTKLLDFLNNMFSFLGEEYVSVLVIGIIYWGLDKCKGEKVGLAALSSLVFNNLIKNVVRRLRPFNVSDKIVLKREVGDYSFPSAHSSLASSVYPTVAYEYRNKKFLCIVATVFPLLVGASRIYLGAHWPTDVVAGLALGLVIFVLIEAGDANGRRKTLTYVLLLALGAAGIFYCTTEDYFTSYGMFSGYILALFFEKKFVNFENTKNPFYIALRTICGGLIFFGLGSGIKALFGLFPLDSPAVSHGLRLVRYCMATFVTVGVYPLVFKPAESFIGTELLGRFTKQK